MKTYPKQKKTKKYKQRIHAKKRARQRLGVSLNSDELRDVARLIRSGESYPIERQSNRVVLHLVFVCDEWMKVVYDKNTKNIVTFLYPDDSDLALIGGGNDLSNM